MTRQPTNDARTAHRRTPRPGDDRARARGLRGPRTPQERAARGKEARAKVPRSSHAGWDGHRIAGSQWICSRSRRRRGSPSSCRSATAGCSHRRSRSTAARPTSWPRTSPRRRDRGSTSRPAATRTCRTSACSGRPSASCCSTSTTSTRPCPGPWEWDVKRLAASLAVAGRNNGFSDAERGDVITASVGEYRTAMRGFAVDAQPRRLVLTHAGPGGAPAAPAAARQEGPQGRRAPRRRRPERRTACRRSTS